MQTGLAHSIPEVCSIASVGRTSLYKAIQSGALRAVKHGRRTLILHHDLLRWVHPSPPPLAVKSIQQSSEERISDHV